MPAEPLTAANPTDRKGELYALAATYPAPPWQDWIADRNWLNEQQLSGALDAHWGKVVAAYNKELIGVGDNYVEMLLELAPKYNVHPERIVCVYLGE